MDKHLKKLFAWLTALSVLFGGVTAGATEEDVASESDVNVEKKTEVGTDGAQAQASAEETSEPASQPQQTTPEATPTEPATAAPSDEAQNVSEATPEPTQATTSTAPSEAPVPAFVAGYAAVASGTIFYGEDEEEKKLNASAVVYAFEYDAHKDRTRVAYNEDAHVQYAWVDAPKLRMLDEAAVEKYLGRDREDVLEWKNCLLWPLDFEAEEDRKQTGVENECVPANGLEGAAVPEGEGGVTTGTQKNVDGFPDADKNTNPAEDNSTQKKQSDDPAEADGDGESGAGAPADVQTSVSAVQPQPKMQRFAMDVAVDVPLMAASAADPNSVSTLSLVVPDLEMDYQRERLLVAAPDADGTLRFYQEGTDKPIYEQALTEACAIDLKQLSAPCSSDVTLRVDFVSEGLETASTQLYIPARPEFAGELTGLEIEAGYTKAKIKGNAGNEYALSVMDETEPSLFSANGEIGGLSGDTAYAIWVRNLSGEGRFASTWKKLEGTSCVTLARTGADASFLAESLTTQLRVEWRPDMDPFDPETGLHFQSGGASIDEEVAGSFSITWRDGEGNLLSAAPVDAGSYTLEITLTGEAERYVLSQAKLSYIIDPIDLSTADFAMFEGERCVYNGQPQYPSGMRVVLDEHVIPEACYELRENGDANRTDAGEACALIVGMNDNVIGQRAFAYRIEQKPLTVIPERLTDMVYSGGAEVPLTREGWALEGAVEGDILTLDLSDATATADSPGAGEGRSVRFEGVRLAGADAENYTIGKIETATINILQAAAPAIEWPSAGTITYGQQISATVLTGGSTQWGSFVWADGARVPNVGTGLFELTFVPNDAENYAWQQSALRAEVQVVVQPRAATIYAGSFEKGVGQADPSFTASTEGVLKGDTLAYTLSRDKGEAMGTYVIYVKPGNNPNYSVKTKNGSLTIRARSINADTVTVSEIPRQVYTGSEIEPKPVVRDGSTLLQRDVDYRLEYHGNRLEGVATVDIVGMGKYSGTRTVSFTIYKLSSIGGIVNDYGVEGESAGVYGAYGEDGEDWESGLYDFLPQSKLLNNPLYDEYLGTGGGLEELKIVRNADGAAQEYELLPIYTATDPDAEAGDVYGSLLVCAGPDESGEAADRTFRFSGMQLARLYGERSVSTLLLRNCETTVCLDVYEMLSGDAAGLARLLDAGEVDAGAALDALDYDALDVQPFTVEELSGLNFELRTRAMEMDSGEPGYELSLYLCLDGAEMEISALLPSLSVGSNVEGLFEAGEEDAFLSRFVNVRMNENGGEDILEGELVRMPEEQPEWQEDEAPRYLATCGDGEVMAVREEQDAQLDPYRCQTLLSAWGGPGLYLLKGDSEA